MERIQQPESRVAENDFSRVEAEDQRVGVEERRPGGQCVPGPPQDPLVPAGLSLPRAQPQLVSYIAVNRVGHMIYHQPGKPSGTRDLPPAQ